MSSEKIERRDFLKLLLASGTIVVTQRPLRNSLSSAPKETSPHKWAMVIDQEKCVGCGDCTLACQAHNDTAPSISWTRMIDAEDVGDKQVFLPVPCMHCEHAPCVGVCPVKATYQRPDGIIMMDYDRCIGCRYCEMACPYGARSFNWEEFDGNNPVVPQWGQPEVDRRPRGVVEKCSFCYQRIDRGLERGLTPGVDRNATPACVNACPVGARTFGDLNDPESSVSRLLAKHPSFRLREDLGTGPRVYYLASHPVEETELEEIHS
jgi:phenylacetyl-CoA:acceptor oxidoreductase subunit 1